MPRYDVAVIGLGAMGAAALCELALRGQRVIGVEKDTPAHARSSSFGETRIIRLAYFEDPAYVPLLHRAYARWRDLEARTGAQVLTVTGILEAGYPGAPLVEGSRRSSIEHGLRHEVLSAAEAETRFLAFTLPADWRCLYQPDAGVLFPERATELHVALAREQGAEVRLGTEVGAVEPAGQGVRLRLRDGSEIEAGAAVVAAGAWAPGLLPGIGRSLTLTRQPLMWFQPTAPELVRPDRMPVFFFQAEDALLYGIPDVCGTGVKAAFHTSGGELASADAPRAEVSAAEAEALAGRLRRLVPAAAGPMTRTSLCLYARSPDEHFIVGPLPEAPQIIIASPCSGHGFKFASVMGEVLADLAIHGQTELPIGLFDPRRFLLS